MRSWQVSEPKPIEQDPLLLKKVPKPEPGEGELMLDVHYCGICRTDLHIVEGDIAADYPVVPGHQVVGTVSRCGPETDRDLLGELRGAYWLHSACGECSYCLRDEENLCTDPQFTGLDVPGGFAQRMVVRTDYSVPISASISPAHAAPLLCAGIIGYRSLRLSEIQPGERLALFGFGSCAHIVIQVAHHWDCEVVVYTRSENHQRLAREMGAVWVGEAGDEPQLRADSAITFAPAGPVVVEALRAVRPGGTVAVNAISMSDIPQFPYRLMYHERTLRSVAHVTRRDAREFMQLAAEIPVETQVQVFDFEKLPAALQRLKDSEIDGSAVLKVECGHLD